MHRIQEVTLIERLGVISPTEISASDLPDGKINYCREFLNTL